MQTHGVHANARSACKRTECTQTHGVRKTHAGWSACGLERMQDEQIRYDHVCFQIQVRASDHWYRVHIPGAGSDPECGVQIPSAGVRSQYGVQIPSAGFRSRLRASDPSTGFRSRVRGSDPDCGRQIPVRGSDPECGVQIPLALRLRDPPGELGRGDAGLATGRGEGGRPLRIEAGWAPAEAAGDFRR